MSTTAVEPLALTTVMNRVGGARGMVDGGLPPLVFVILNTAARASMAPTDAVRLALAGALVTGAILIVVRRTRGRTLAQATGGLAGLVVAALFARWPLTALAVVLTLAYLRRGLGTAGPTPTNAREESDP